MSLAATPGHVDVMVASELIEAARAMQNGYVTQDRTTLIASTHRVYATVEKIHAVDGRFDSARVLDAARQLARRSILFDMQRVAQENGTVINAVLFGALAGSGALPLPRAACEQAILRAGKGTEASLRGFTAAFEIAAGERNGGRLDVSNHVEEGSSGKSTLTPFLSRIESQFPAVTHEVIRLGVARLIDYQGPAYAGLYLGRVKSILEWDEEPYRLVSEAGRHLALWMSYEDVIRVADLKTRPSRFARVRREARAKPNEPVVVIDYLKPGIEEFASILPPPLGWRLIGWAERKGKLNAYSLGMHIKTSTIHGWLLTRCLAWLKPWRPHTWRFHEEQRLIERWLRAVRAAARRDTALALEIAECARLIKGYGDTLRRGRASLIAILGTLVDNPPTTDPREQAARIRKARESALSDPEKPVNVHRQGSMTAP
jgi:indolepyruvate ferredoxin oxidoreductase beta subunit